jgi:phosphate transport system ATP-binding protein
MDVKLETRRLNLHYGTFQALRDVSLSIRPRAITAIIGPSGCGKSTLLRCYNRMNDLIDSVRISGQILLDGVDIHAPGVSLTELRRRVGMVFQRPNPFPLSIFDNVAYGPRVHGSRSCRDKSKLRAVVQSSLQSTRLWGDLKDRLDDPALDLSPEQQQRLCISRLLAVEPEVLLMDEPCSALDPIATGHIEELMLALSERYTIVIVTHNMQQAARVSSETAVMLLGDLVEFGPTVDIFERPKDKRTEDYVTGRYG